MCRLRKESVEEDTEALASSKPLFMSRLVSQRHSCALDAPASYAQRRTIEHVLDLTAGHLHGQVLRAYYTLSEFQTQLGLPRTRATSQPLKVEGQKGQEPTDCCIAATLQFVS